MRLDALLRRSRAFSALHWLIRPFGYLEITKILHIDPHSEFSRPSYAGVKTRIAASEDIEFICERMPREQPSHVLRGRWAAGHHCFVAEIAGEIVAYDWIAFQSAQEQEFEIRLDPHQAVCMDCYVHPTHRGKRLHHALLCAMLDFARMHGKTDVLTCVALLDPSAWKAHILMGWNVGDTIVYFRPNFTIKRLPWLLTQEHPTVHVNWERHAWRTIQRESLARAERRAR